EDVPIETTVAIPAGPAPQPEPATEAARQTDGSVGAELERLVKLRDSGALTDAEFQTLKARVIGAEQPAPRRLLDRRRKSRYGIPLGGQHTRLPEALWHGVCVTVDVTADGGGVISAGFAAASTQHAVGDRAAVLAQQAFAPATRLAYAHDWAVFT